MSHDFHLSRRLGGGKSWSCRVVAVTVADLVRFIRLCLETRREIVTVFDGGFNNIRKFPVKHGDERR